MLPFDLFMSKLRPCDNKLKKVNGSSIGVLLRYQHYLFAKMKNVERKVVFFLLCLLLTYASSSRKSMIVILYNSNNVIRMK